MVPAVSVVLCTYNRAALLGDALESLLALSPSSPAHELIIVDNNSRDGTREVIERYAARSAGRLRYVFEGKQGLSHARNAGIAESRGAIVAFTDDDVRADPEWLIALAGAFAAHPEVDFVGGKVLPMWPAPPPAWLTRAHWSPLALLDRGDVGERLSARRSACLVGANVAFRRTVFEEFAGFDPAYQHERGAVSAVEDHELELRLYEAGRQAWYEPTAVIHAEVQANRLSRRYHRRWHYDHGRAAARLLPSGYMFDRGGIRRPKPPTARHALGIPLYMWRTLLEAPFHIVRAMVAGRADEAFLREAEFRETLGALSALRDTRRGSRNHGSAPAHPTRGATPASA